MSLPRSAQLARKAGGQAILRLLVAHPALPANESLGDLSVNHSGTALAVAAAAVVVAGASVLGMSAARSSTSKMTSVTTVKAAKAATETECTGPHGVTADYGRSADFTLCAVTDGSTLTVQYNASCFAALGLSQFPHCSPYGSWSLYKGETLVTEGRAGTAVLYPGPGTYTLKATLYAEARKDPSDGAEGTSGFTANGSMSANITLATAIASGPRLSGGAGIYDGERAVTITNVGNEPADGVVILISNNSSVYPPLTTITDDTRCSTDIITTECTVGTLAPGASTSVDLNESATDVCSSSSTPMFGWSYAAEGSPLIFGDGPC